jgi:hypothetical protein
MYIILNSNFEFNEFFYLKNFYQDNINFKFKNKSFFLYIK